MSRIQGWTKRIGCMVLSGLLLAGTAACSAQEAAGGADPASAETAGQTTDAAASGETEDTTGSGQTASSGSVYARPVLFDRTDGTAETETVKASVPAYTVDSDLGNVVNIEQFWIPEAWKKNLAEDHFYVADNGSGEFFEIYEGNRYVMVPSFVTVDSLMHSYHLYFAYLMKTIERDYLVNELRTLTEHMLELACAQAGERLAASETIDESWQEAAERNIAFFAIARSLLDPSWKADTLADTVSSATMDIIRGELALIDAAEGIAVSPLSGALMDMEDYSQYKPRGYYDTDENLARYFKAMMWYGRRNFPVKDASMTKSALLMSAVMDDEAYEKWSSIYAVTSFFAGESDDNGICEYRVLIPEAYGAPAEQLGGAKLMSDEKGFASFGELAAKLDPPAINSVPMMDDGGATDKKAENTGFRFMGQRFSLDAAIFQHLIYSEVKENAAGDTRLLPEALDVPAALGSSLADKLVHELYGAGDYQDYDKNLSELKQTIQNAPAETWQASLYAGWLHTLCPLLTEKGEGYPAFMQSEKWAKKDLECFLGSYTELKHDTVLYSKQVMAELGGGEDEETDDRGYVEPEPVVFARFARLAADTREGLERLGYLSADAQRDLKRLEEIAVRLKTISDKELANELPTEEEFEFIRVYGGELEHFWQEAYRRDAANPDYFTSQEFPAAVVVDIATDPNGSVLEVANDNPATILVVVPLDGTLRLARGSVYSFYQFEKPISERMTDHEWRVLLGIDENDKGERNWERVGVPDKPSWTMDYRVNYADAY